MITKMSLFVEATIFDGAPTRGGGLMHCPACQFNVEVAGRCMTSIQRRSSGQWKAFSIS
jgi:hypothetical protein